MHYLGLVASEASSGEQLPRIKHPLGGFERDDGRDGCGGGRGDEQASL